MTRYVKTPHPILIGCGARKLDHRSPAKDLYIGSLFQARRRYAEASGGRWAILSALHGLVHPEQPLDPYDLGLAELTPQEMRAWVERVRSQMRESLFASLGPVEVHLTGPYKEMFSASALGSGPWIWPVPAGLQIGQLLHWYRTNRSEGK